MTGVTSLTSLEPQHAFIYTSGTLTDLGTLGGTDSLGLAINAAGVMTGSANLQGDVSHHAFLYSSGKMSDLGTLGGANSSGAAINLAGVVVGESDIAGDTATHAFMFTAGTWTDLGTLGGTNSSALAINDNAQVCRQSGCRRWQRPCLPWSNGVLSDLNAVVDPASLPTGVFLVSAMGINGRGAIVANASDGNAYLLAPIAFSPSSLAFGNQAIGTTAGRAITVSNTGAVPITISSILAPSVFTQANDCPTVIQPQASCTIDVTFAPQGPDAQNGSLVAVSDAISIPLAVTGMGVNSPTGGGGSVDLGMLHVLSALAALRGVLGGLLLRRREDFARRAAPCSE